MNSQFVTIERDAAVAEIRLTQPERRNQFDKEMHEHFAEALGVLASMSDVRAAVLSAEGKVFSAGGDFAYMLEMHKRPVEIYEQIYGAGMRTIDYLIDIPIPIVAAVQGHAIGLGATIVLGCDAVVAARGVRIADPHVVLGLVAGDGGALFWPQAVGMLRAKRHLLTGDPILAEDGYTFGLVTDLVDDPGDVEPTARALAHRIASLPPLGVQGTKRTLNAALKHRAAEVVELGYLQEARSNLSEDHAEAIAAFREKRPGRYGAR